MSVGSATASAPAPQTSVFDNIPLLTFKGEMIFCDETAEKIARLEPVPNQAGLNRLMLKRDKQDNKDHAVMGPTFSCDNIDKLAVRDHAPLATLGNPSFKFAGVVEIVIYEKAESPEKQCSSTMIVDLWEDFLCLCPKEMDPAIESTPKFSCYQIMEL